MGGVELVSLVSGSSLVAAAIGAWATRKTSKTANEVTRFEAITNALDARIEDLKDQLDEVRRDLATLRAEYDSEVERHKKTISKLQTAIDHIRSLVSWINRHRDPEHHDPVPQTPPALEGLL